MNDKSIFLIETYDKIEEEEKYPDFGASRAPGFYYTFEDAEETVINNYGDIYEFCYNYASIHEIKPGLYPHYEMRKFYKYNELTEKYEPIEEPTFLKHYGICAIG